MWRLFKALFKGRTKTFTRKGLAAKLNPLKIPSKLKRSLNFKKQAVRRTNRFKRTFKRIVRATSPKQRLKEDLMVKSQLVENLVTIENEILAKRSNAERSISETSSEILKNNKLLDAFSHAELKEINKHIDKELANIGVKSAKDLEGVIRDEEYREDLVKTNAYETFMDNWKEGFFSLDSESVEGMSEEEKEVVWQQIVESRTPNSEWWSSKIAE